MKTFDAEAFAAEWIDAFNARDLFRILDHYGDAIELVSPIYREFTGGATDRLSGKPALADYFGTALALYPELHFTLLDVAKGTRSLCLRYLSNIGDRHAIECFEFGPDGKASRVLCHYQLAA